MPAPSVPIACLLMGVGLIVAVHAVLASAQTVGTTAQNEPVPAKAAAKSAAVTAKDIVLAALQPSEEVAAASSANGSRTVDVRSDGLVVSILTPTPSGTLLPRSAASPFKTGERFRVKVLVPRDGEVAFYNTNPAGQLSAAPLLQMSARRGLEIVSEEFQLTGGKGEDQLHVVLLPSTVPIAQVGDSASRPTAGSSEAASTPPPTPSEVARTARESRLAAAHAWLRGVLGGSRAKSSPLTVENTSQGTYAAAPPGEGVTVTVRIRHE